MWSSLHLPCILGNLWLQTCTAAVEVQNVLNILKHIRCLIPLCSSFPEKSLLDMSDLQFQNERATPQMSSGASVHVLALLNPWLPGSQASFLVCCHISAEHSSIVS